MKKMVIKNDHFGDSYQLEVKCPHQFFKIADETKKTDDQVQAVVRWGVKIMCALCGERRILWTDGEVEICQK